MNHVPKTTPLVGPRFDRWVGESKLRRHVPRCALLLAAFIVGLILPAQSAFAAPGDTHTQAVQKGVDFLTPDVVAFTNQNGCVACHRQGAALYGLSLAKGAGFNVSTDDSSGVPSIATTIVNDEQPDGWWDWGGPNNLKTSYNFYGLSGYDAYVATAHSDKLVKAADWAISIQQDDGRWIMDFEDGQTAHGDVTATARFMVGIAQAMQRVDANKAATYKASLDKAVGYLTAHENDSDDVSGVAIVYELSWGLVGLKAAGLPDNDPTVLFFVSLLEQRQSSLGYAWGNFTNDSPDVFNSGMAIYALCKAGVPAIGNTALQQSLSWVNDQQGPDGTWGSDIYTTFAILGLSCYGDYGVIVTNSGPVTKVISSNLNAPQTATYDFDVQNHGFVDDTYNLTVVGGMPGWSASIPSSIAISAGQHATVTLTVHAPPNLPQALPVQMTVVATSQALSTLSANARITTFTDPPPPSSGDSTSVNLTSGNGATVLLAQSTHLSATVSDTTSNSLVVGPGKGVVTFFIAGLAVATDTDADGDGVFSFDFTPDCGWSALGAQDFRAIYSGIDLPQGQTDMLSSLSSGTITLSAPACCPKPETCNGQDDDCDGVADNGNPGGGASCSTGLPGACSQGSFACSLGGLICVPSIQPGQQAETCNGVDDDCDGSIDNGFQVGQACTNGVGACSVHGTFACLQDGTSACNAVAGEPQTEICGDKVDSDCDGNPNNGCQCLIDSDCGGATSGLLCANAGGESFTCVVGCRGAGGNGCGAGRICSSSNSTPGQCVECLADSDCGDATSGSICNTDSQACEAGCRASGGNGCSGSLHCTSTDGSIGSCVGCLADSDCGDAASGLICDAASTSCVSGCHASGNGCPTDMVCSSTTDSIGTCALSGDTGSGGSGSTASSTGSGPSVRMQGSIPSVIQSGGGAGGSGVVGKWNSVGGNASSADSPTDQPTALSGNGCACSTAPGHDSEGAAWFAIGALGFLVSRRRRNRAA